YSFGTFVVSSLRTHCSHLCLHFRRFRRSVRHRRRPARHMAALFAVRLLLHRNSGRRRTHIRRANDGSRSGRRTAHSASAQTRLRRHSAPRDPMVRQTGQQLRRSLRATLGRRRQRPGRLGLANGDHLSSVVHFPRVRHLGIRVVVETVARGDALHPLHPRGVGGGRLRRQLGAQGQQTVFGALDESGHRSAVFHPNRRFS
ncbi:unnamed protein product, partial [Oppiella nova]